MEYRFERPAAGKNSAVQQNGGKRILLLAARQTELTALLEDAGFEVDARKRPIDGEVPDVALAVVFRGRLLGRNQAATLRRKGIPVVEVLRTEPTSPATGDWLRISNRVHKSDLVQIVRALADRA
jgi:hypothetical protein